MLPINKVFDKVKPKNEEELLLALVIGEKKVKCGIWTDKQGKGEILSFGSSEGWGGESAEELIVAADASIATAVNKLPEVTNKQPTKVILGLPEHWLDGNSIKDERAKVLQTVCRKLLLTPQGFVVTPEGIAHFLKKEEGELTSVILVNLEEAELIVSLIAGGKYLGSKIVGRSNNLALDLEEGLLRFEYREVLPPRILLIDGESLEEAKQSLIAYPWIGPERQKKLAFLQLPRVDSADSNLEVSAVVFAGSKETKPQETIAEEPEEKVETIVEAESEAVPQPEIKEENFGFVQGEDITLQESRNAEPVLEEEPAEEEKPPELRSFPRRSFNFHSVLGIFNRVSRLPFVLDLSFFKRGLLPFLLGFLIIVGLTALAFWQFVRVQLTFLVKPAVVEKEIEFTIISKGQGVDVEKMTVPGIEVTAEVSGQKTAEVQGRKTVGEKATGNIMIYNGTDKTKTLSKGTIIKGQNDLKFVLDQEVSVPAKTTDLNVSPPIDKWGEKKASAVAADIGTQYNLAANLTFSLESATATASSIIIKNPEAFSGGTSREISAVSKEDRESLQKSLQTELQAKAESDIKAKISSGFILPDSFGLKTKTDGFNHEVGDEANQLSLEEKSVFTAIYFKEEDLKILIEKVFASLVPEGYEKNFIDEAKDVSLLDRKKNLYRAKVARRYYPQIDKKGISQRFVAKKFSQVKGLTADLKFIEDYELTVTPNVFSRLSFFPINGKNITITIKSAL